MFMKNGYVRTLTLLIVVMTSVVFKVNAQIYGKLNGLYALAGIINPAVEFKLSPKSTFQTEFTYSPWNAIRWDGVDRPMKFIIFINEYRRYFKEHNKGWYLGGNVGMMAFNMTKPIFMNGKFTFKHTSAKGYGFMLGISGGYEWIFKDKWMLDVFFGFAWMNSHYNPYALVDGVVEGGHIYNKGEVILTPGNGEWGDRPVDPFNGSGEWLPNKLGVSFGVLLFDPQKHRLSKNNRDN